MTSKACQIDQEKGVQRVEESSSLISATPKNVCFSGPFFSASPAEKGSFSRSFRRRPVHCNFLPWCRLPSILSAHWHFVKGQVLKTKSLSSQKLNVPQDCIIHTCAYENRKWWSQTRWDAPGSLKNTESTSRAAFISQKPVGWLERAR